MEDSITLSPMKMVFLVVGTASDTSTITTTNNTFYVNNQWTTSASGYQEIVTLNIEAIWVPYNSVSSDFFMDNVTNVVDSWTELTTYYYLSETSVVIAPVKP